jgi:arylformamidase
MRPLTVRCPLSGIGSDSPGQCLREALAGIRRELEAIGLVPGAIVRMNWSVPDPGAFHLARRDIDLAYREVFGGTRPPIALRVGSTAELAIEVEFSAPVAPSSAVWAGFTAAELMREYVPRGQVRDMGAMFHDWSMRGQAFRSGFAALDLMYGTRADEMLDLYRPPNVVRPPLWVFIHGGYWQSCTKNQHAQFTAGMVRNGFAVANIDYPLAPPADLGTIARSVAAAIRFLVAEADALDIDTARLHVAGHSAGGHLAALAALDRDGPPIRSALLLSGLFDLSPLAALPLGRLLGLSEPDRVTEWSPARQPAPDGVRVSFGVGGLESSEFKRQSRDLALSWSAPAPLIVPDRNHFDLLDSLIDGDLLNLALATAS